MKIVPNRILHVLVAMISGASAFAGPGSGAPPQPGLPPPGLPIDGGIVILIIIAIAFGFIKIYRFKLNKKTPI